VHGLLKRAGLRLLTDSTVWLLATASYRKGGQPGASCAATIWSAAAQKLASEQAIAKTFQSTELVFSVSLFVFNDDRTVSEESNFIGIGRSIRIRLLLTRCQLSAKRRLTAVISEYFGT